LAFGQKGEQNNHINTTHKKIKRYWCDVCDYSSYNRSNLEQHSNNVHLEKKYFQCDICDQAFSRKSNLVRHSNRIHKKLKTYSCDLEALMKEAQKDDMIVSIENIIVFE
jgi:KRAB domain-containing zinc finger protein